MLGAGPESAGTTDTEVLAWGHVEVGGALLCCDMYKTTKCRVRWESGKAPSPYVLFLWVNE